MNDAIRPGIGATVLGYPRIGPDRELKHAIEDYWAGRAGRAELEATAARLRHDTWAELAGLDSIPGNTFSYYDQVLDTAVLFGAVPDRYAALGLDDLDTYFALARGNDRVAPLELTKWFDTNYHYLVPELGPDTALRLAGDKPLAEYAEARAAGVETRPVLIGPVTFLRLAKPAPGAPSGFTPLDLLDPLLDAYAELLRRLAAAGAAWVQLDEPAFVTDSSEAELAALRRAYDRLSALPERPGLLVAGYFGDLGEALPVLADTAVEAVALDLVTAPRQVAGAPGLRGKTVVAGVVDGRNVWRTDLDRALSRSATLLGLARDVAVSTSCSLLHVPYDVEAEPDLPETVRPRLAFARQKLDEVAWLQRALLTGRPPGPPRMRPVPDRDGRVRARIAALRPEHRTRVPYAERAAAQQARLRLPDLATTTIGSFPQTREIRRARAAYRDGSLDGAAYTERMREEIARVIRLQEDLGLDVLVHGEPERSDMVQYFAELLDGFAATANGWVQSYGTRCVRPPILHGDVSRPRPMTVPWTVYAQSLTDRPVKGMLTGPVTILAWSFVRDDQPLADTAAQVALALRDEISDLERAGIRIVQVDEPALRELLPPRSAGHAAYLDWSVGAFRLATAGAAAATQIHTHLCYSEFGDVIDAIDGLDADVTTVEAARSHMEILEDLAATGFSRGIGPGVYDIHAPRVPPAPEIRALVDLAAKTVPGPRLWVNPDCGLKTRTYEEVEPALRNMVEAARESRPGSPHQR